MTLHQLRVFLKVVELHSFTQAARALRISQPSVSALVQDLAQEFGVKLFDRRGMKVVLTSGGNVLFRRAREAVVILDGTKEEVEEVEGLKKGKIRVGATVLPTAAFLPTAVERFRKAHPGIEINSKVERSDVLEQLLFEGELDVMITTSLPRSPHLISEPLREEKVVVIAPPKHPLARRHIVPLKLLANEPLICYERGNPIRDMVEERFAAKGFPFAPAVRVDFKIGGRDAIRSAVASSLGISFTAKQFVMGDIGAGRVKVLNVPELKLKRIVYLAVPSSQSRSPLVQEFVIFLKKSGGTGDLNAARP